MEFFVFLIFLLFVFGLLSGEKKAKPEKKTRLLRAGGRDEGDSYPESWKSYEQAERDEGMQQDLDPSKLYEVSKARLDTARKKAAQKLSYQGLPTVKTPDRKNKGRRIDVDPLSPSGQPPLIRDMNLQRRIFLSGAGNRIFGEREKTRGGTKTLLVFVVLGVLAAYILNANFG